MIRENHPMHNFRRTLLSTTSPRGFGAILMVCKLRWRNSVDECRHLSIRATFWSNQRQVQRKWRQARGDSSSITSGENMGQAARRLWGAHCLFLSRALSVSIACICFHKTSLCTTPSADDLLSSISFSLIESVALAVRCCHQTARFRHRNMYLIRVDHLPLGKL